MMIPDVNEATEWMDGVSEGNEKLREGNKKEVSELKERRRKGNSKT